MKRKLNKIELKKIDQYIHTSWFSYNFKNVQKKGKTTKTNNENKEKQKKLNSD